MGLTTDHCVVATALDAQASGFTTRVLLRYTAGVSPDTTKTAVARMTEAGIGVITGVSAADRPA